MEVKGANFLYTLATLMITFAGFSALLLSIRQTLGAGLSPLDKFIVKTILVHFFILTCGALLPPLLGLWDVSEAWLWRVSALCFAIPMLALLATYSHRRRKTVGTGPPPAGFAVFVIVGSAAIAAMLVYIIGGFEYQPAAYVTGLTVNFFTAAFGFVTALDVILQQPVGSSAPESLQNIYHREGDS
ncbi:MAG: hypothetical protein WAK55_18905 [Xanthobacteraceae bacterium]